ncbi:Predicted dehydrogenase [Friedmanniella luteola]|uniref:Predicted dehydrogenase n=1 Tax=Friedmanniella luteola TaxID=546871 RepID=A0A1H1SFA2_9ACTN|nr:Gfo/Idh/MocA family oxidoreductase [Friedmanniella luteola]SDS46406.1 Predicted dehydrogenase [Friedmanniella luteola]
MPTAAVIGCGDVSVVHLDALASLPDVELVGVVEPDRDRREAAAQKYGVPGFPDQAALLAQARPDVVHVTTPHHTHVELALACLEQGVHVVLEKPLASTVADGERLAAAADAGSAKIAVCFQNRYNAAVRGLHERLTSGELGTVLGAAATVVWHREASYYENRPWRSTWAGSGGGLLMNQAIHTVDLVQWLVGDVTGVEGHASTRALAGAIEVEDTAEIALQHASGARSVFYATLAHAANAPVTLDVVTEQATLSLRGDLTITHADGRSETVRERTAATGGRSYWGVSHELLLADFYARLGDPEPFWISPREALKSLRIVKDVYRQSYPGLGDAVA